LQSANSEYDARVAVVNEMTAMIRSKQERGTRDVDEAIHAEAPDAADPKRMSQNDAEATRMGITLKKPSFLQPVARKRSNPSTHEANRRGGAMRRNQSFNMPAREASFNPWNRGSFFVRRDSAAMRRDSAMSAVRESARETPSDAERKDDTEAAEPGFDGSGEDAPAEVVPSAPPPKPRRATFMTRVLLLGKSEEAEVEAAPSAAPVRCLSADPTNASAEPAGKATPVAPAESPAAAPAAEGPSPPQLPPSFGKLNSKWAKVRQEKSELVRKVSCHRNASCEEVDTSRWSCSSALSSAVQAEKSETKTDAPESLRKQVVIGSRSMMQAKAIENLEKGMQEMGHKVDGISDLLHAVLELMHERLPSSADATATNGTEVQPMARDGAANGSEDAGADESAAV